MEAATSRRDTATSALLDAAERLLIETGYAGLTTRGVAAEAGVNHGLVHYYFGSMEELLLQVLERFTERLVERQTAMYEGDAPFLEKWRTAMRWLEEDVDAGYPKVWWELQAMAWNHPEMQERLVQVDGIWRGAAAHLLRERPRRVRHRLPRRGDGVARDGVQQGRPDRAAVGSHRGPPRAARLDRRLAGGEGGNPMTGRKRVLYISSPIGLGHARRDVAIARELRAAGRRRRDRLACAGPGDPSARARGRAGASREPLAGKRVGPLRVRVGRARPPLLPGVAPHGRDPDHELHGLPRRRARGALRPLDRRRGLGARLLPAREPRREARPLRLADGLRRLASDGGRRRSRGLPHGRLQRRDGRAHRHPPGGARPRPVRRQPRRHRARSARPGPPADPRLDRGQLRLRRVRVGLRSGRAGRPRAPARRARIRARRAGLRRDGRRLRGREGPCCSR